MTNATCRECDGAAWADGLCHIHHWHWSRQATLVERFWVKTDKNGPLPPERPELGPCWLWTAAKNAVKGYGVFRVSGKNFVAHRWAYENLVGPVPEGMELSHLCRTPACVRPDHLDPVATGRGLTAAERFWPKVDKNGPLPDCRPELGPCWIWTATRNPNGYGDFSNRKGGKRHVLAHRWSYEQMVGSIPEGLELDHLCRTRACVRPDHLEPVTHRTNGLRSPVAPPTINAGKLYCDYGHEFTPENTRIGPEGSRWCRECQRARRRQRHAARVAAQIRAGTRLADDQLSELRSWIECGRAQALRENAGLSLEGAARDASTNGTSLAHWERGAQFPRPATAARYYRMLAALNRQQAA
jgi:DNA-binding transcriptional regulator YiaG